MATGEFSKFALILTSFVTQTVKLMPAIAMQETRVQSLGWEDSLKKWMAIHSSILAWRIPWTEEAGGLHSMGSQELDMIEHLPIHKIVIT